MYLGIDFGTDFLRAAVLNSSGIPELISDRHSIGGFHTQSTILFGPDGAWVGKPASLMQDEIRDPVLIAQPKRTLCLDQCTPIDIFGNSWNADTIVALLFRKIDLDLKKQGLVEPNKVVIGTPVGLNETLYRLVESAAHLNGWESIQIVDEMTAAFVYQRNRHRIENIRSIVVGWGAGYFQTAIFQKDGDRISQIARKSVRLGKFDSLKGTIAEALAEQLASDGRLIEAERSRLKRCIPRLASIVEQQLLVEGRETARVMEVAGDIVVEFFYSNAQASEVIDRLVKENFSLVTELLRDSNLTWSMMDEVILCGGVNNFPPVANGWSDQLKDHIKTIVQLEFGTEVAYGCAMLAEDERPFDITFGRQNSRIQTIPCDIGILSHDKKTKQSKFVPIITSGERIPTSKSLTMYTSRHDQTRLIVELFARFSGNETPVSIGRKACTIHEPKKNQPVHVSINAHDRKSISLKVAQENSPSVDEFDLSIDQKQNQDNRQALLLKSTTLLG